MEGVDTNATVSRRRRAWVSSDHVHVRALRSQCLPMFSCDGISPFRVIRARSSFAHQPRSGSAAVRTGGRRSCETTSRTGRGAGGRSYAREMTIEERIDELEDMVIRLSFVLELKTGAYSHDGNPKVRDEGQLIERWARAIQERRAGS